jgi:hypothetical protein
MRDTIQFSIMVKLCQQIRDLEFRFLFSLIWFWAPLLMIKLAFWIFS